MITIFNRKELAICFKMEQQAQFRTTLADNHIDYQVKVINRNSPSPLSSGSRARTGTFGNRQDSAYEYIFYVHKSDFLQAASLIGKNVIG